MARPIVLSNGELHVGINRFGMVHDFYYPYVGLENHSAGKDLRHKIGIWVEGTIAWLDNGDWTFIFGYPHLGLIGHIVAKNERIGIAIAISDIICPLTTLSNDKDLFENILRIIKDHKIDKIYVGMCEGEVALATKKFVDELSNMIKLPVETVEEAVSTIEADNIYKSNKHKVKNYKKTIDAVAAAVILRRAI